MAYPEPFDLAGKVAVVTGAASGLGLEFAMAMAEAGANVVCADVNEAGARETAGGLDALGVQALAVRCDVTQEPEVERMVAEAVDRFGTVDILFNNAGIADPEPLLLHEYPSQNWHRVHDVDLHGVFYVAKHSLRVMVERRSGKVINIASMWGLAGGSSILPVPAYNSAKGAVVNLTRELGLQYATHGIQVNAICPGFFYSRLGPYDDPEFRATIEAFTPMRRVAEAKEIRGAAIFLASAASSFMTGQTLVIDGGALAK